MFFHDRSMENGNIPTRQEWLKAQLKQAGRVPSAHLTNSSLFYRRHIDEEADAALVAVDKSRPSAYMAIAFACWMTIKEVRDAITYHRWFGDKDTYWLAAELAGVPYAFEPWSSARLAQEPSVDKGRQLFTPKENPVANQPASQVTEGVSRSAFRASPATTSELLRRKNRRRLWPFRQHIPRLHTIALTQARRSNVRILKASSTSRAEATMGICTAR